jgi:hypothetical protein
LFKKIATAAVLVATALTFQPSAADAVGTPIQITKVVLYKKYPTFIVLKVTSKNTTRRDIHLVGYQCVLDKDGYTTYEAPDWNEVSVYEANNICTGDYLNGYWSPGQVATGTWCFSVPRGRSIKSVYVSASMFGNAMYSKAVSIKH